VPAIGILPGIYLSLKACIGGQIGPPNTVISRALILTVDPYLNARNAGAFIDTPADYLEGAGDRLMILRPINESLFWRRSIRTVG